MRLPLLVNIMRSNNIIATTEWDRTKACLDESGKALIEQPQSFLALVSERLGTKDASLFAEPEKGVSKLRGAEILTWTSSHEGVFRPFDSLSQEETRTAENILRTRLQNLASIDEPALRADLSRAVCVPNRSDLFFNGEAVVIIRWAMSDSKSGAGVPLTSALTPYLPEGFEPAPVFVPDNSRKAEVEDTDNATGVAAAAIGSGAAAGLAGTSHAAAPQAPGSADAGAGPAAGADSGPTGNSGSGTGGPPPPGAPVFVSAVPRDDGIGRPVVVTFLVATLLLLLCLLYLLWPGNLVYRQGGVATALDPANARTALEAANRQIEDDIAMFRRELAAENLCAIPPGTRTDRIADVPLVQTAPNASPAMAPAAVEPAVPGNGADNSQTDLPPAVEPGSSGAFLDTLDRGTVFVVGLTGGGGVSMGTGFVVDAGHVLTNRHVVEELDGSGLFITNQFTDGPIAAEIVSASRSSEISGDDFALLKLSRNVDLPSFTFSDGTRRLDEVVAAGYPSFVISTDPGFVAAFRDGDFSQLPAIQMAVTRGEVTQMQLSESGTRLILHSAQISPGNSGGPLVDRCGRVVGVNTFTRLDQANSLRLNFALSAKDAASFLEASNISASMDTSACAVAVAESTPRGEASGPVAGADPDGGAAMPSAGGAATAPATNVETSPSTGAAGTAGADR